MPRVSPWDQRFRRKGERTETIPLPELETSLTLREAADPLRQGQIWDLVERYVHLHVAPEPGGKPRKLLPGPDGQVVETSRDLFANVAAIEIMQVVPDGEERWTMLEIVGLAKNLPERWEEVLLTVARLTKPEPTEAGTPGNSAPGGTSSSSAPA